MLSLLIRCIDSGMNILKNELIDAGDEKTVEETRQYRQEWRSNWLYIAVAIYLRCKNEAVRLAIIRNACSDSSGWSASAMAAMRVLEAKSAKDSNFKGVPATGVLASLCLASHGVYGDPKAECEPLLPKGIHDKIADVTFINNWIDYDAATIATNPKASIDAATEAIKSAINDMKEYVPEFSGDFLKDKSRKVLYLMTHMVMACTRYGSDRNSVCPESIADVIKKSWLPLFHNENRQHCNREEYGELIWCLAIAKNNAEAKTRCVEWIESLIKLEENEKSEENLKQTAPCWAGAKLADKMHSTFARHHWCLVLALLCALFVEPATISPVIKTRQETREINAYVNEILKSKSPRLIFTGVPLDVNVAMIHIDNNNNNNNSPLYGVYAARELSQGARLYFGGERINLKNAEALYHSGERCVGLLFNSNVGLDGSGVELCCRAIASSQYSASELSAGPKIIRFDRKFSNDPVLETIWQGGCGMFVRMAKSVEKANCELKEDGKHLFVELTRIISTNEELLLLPSSRVSFSEPSAGQITFSRLEDTIAPYDNVWRGISAAALSKGADRPVSGQSFFHPALDCHRDLPVSVLPRTQSVSELFKHSEAVLSAIDSDSFSLVEFVPKPGSSEGSTQSKNVTEENFPAGFAAALLQMAANAETTDWQKIKIKQKDILGRAAMFYDQTTIDDESKTTPAEIFKDYRETAIAIDACLDQLSGDQANRSILRQFYQTIHIVTGAKYAARSCFLQRSGFTRRSRSCEWWFWSRRRDIIN